MTKVVDVGCGLGYLGEELTRLGLDVLGLEGNTSHSEGGERRRGSFLKILKKLEMEVE